MNILDQDRKKSIQDRSLYWGMPCDKRRLVILFIRNIWKVCAGMLAGTLICALAYLAYSRLSNGRLYSGYSQFYIDFAIDANGNAAYDYYNGYTWNDLMTTGMIADYTLDKVSDKSIDIPALEAATRADILSDIRVLKVTYTDSDESRCADIQQATEYALVTLGENAREFERITLIKSVEPVRQYADNRMLQAVLLGAIAGFVISLIILLFAYVLDDSILVPADVSVLGLPVLAVCTRDRDDRLTQRLNAAFGSEAYEEDAVHIDASLFQNTEEDFAGYKSDKPVIVDVSYAQTTVSALALLLDRLALYKMEVRGIIIKDADNRFYKAYYGFGKRMRI